MRWWRLTFIVGLSSLAALTYQAWSSMSPLARYYLQPKAEVEMAGLLPPVSVLGHPLFTPHVALVVRMQGGGWRWVILPVAQVGTSLASVYPTALTTLAFRVLLVGVVQAAIVLVAVWIDLRAAVQTARRTSQAPTSPYV